MTQLAPHVWLALVFFMGAVVVAVDVAAATVGHPTSRAGRRTPNAAPGAAGREAPSPAPARPTRRRRERLAIAVGVAVTVGVFFGACFAGWQWQAEAQRDLDRVSEQEMGQ